MTLHLSPFQYNMLRIVLQKKVFTLEEAAIYKQGTFGSMANRNYLVTELNGDEVTLKVTATAKEAMMRYESTDVTRINQDRGLSHFVLDYVRRSQKRSHAPKSVPIRKRAEKQLMAGPGLG